MSELKEFTAGMAELAEGSDRLRNFCAIQDVPPQKTLFLSTSGEVRVANPGVDVELSSADPQGINPNILILNVIALQRPGIWPQVLTWKSVSDFRVLHQHGQFTQVMIDFAGESVTVDVVDR